MENNKLQEELLSIRTMMERSSKFISLSGLSGVMAGIYALAGAFAAYRIIYRPAGVFGYRDFVIPNENHDGYPLLHSFLSPVVLNLILIAVAVLLASIITCYILTSQKAKKHGQAMWGKTSRTLLFTMAVPLVTGGLLILILISRGYLGVVAPACLAFYGLALVSASAYTFTDIKYLGLCEIALGIIAAILPGYGLLFWAIGFGVLHIVYGSLLYTKYDR